MTVPNPLSYYCDVNFTKKMHYPTLSFNSFQAFQFTDKHGEVCPAGWKPGKKSMKPNAEGVSEYLAAQEMEKEK